MSWAIVARVLKTKVGSPSGKAVLIALANHCDENGKSCFPGQELIQEITELSADTIQRQIKTLIDGRFISGIKQRKKGHWESWDYQINLSMLWEDQAAPCGTAARAPGRTMRHGQAAPCGTDRAAPCGINLSLKPFNKPSRARGPSCPDGLGPLAAPLRNKIGRANFTSWFREAGITDATEDSVTIELPNAWKADEAEKRFGTDVLACLQVQQSSIERVKFVARRAA
jgi:Helix-turn-helix domain